MAVRFGTDGVRGRAITELTPEAVMALGRAAAEVLAAPTVLIGRDTRRSGTALEAALSSGLAAEGVNVQLLGVVPTPAVAWWAARDHLPAAMVTASHNPWTDNGIKLFAAGGRKLDDAQQHAIEARLERSEPALGRHSDRVGVITHRHDGGERYGEAVVTKVGAGALRGLRLAVDAANGAMGPLAATVLERLGAHVEVHFTSNAGDDINDRCGATAPAALAAVMRASSFDLGLAFDGDGDRVIALDHTGRVIDGDRLIALAAVDRAKRGLLPTGQVVVTVMTNLGCHRALRAQGIEVITTGVGDRQVLEAMERSGSVLGGEQSGHIIHRDLMPSGDGLLAGALVAELVARTGRPLADLAAEVMTTLPQVLVNVPVPQGRIPAVVEALAPEVAAVEADLGDAGRVVVRPSGTEPLIRIMVEAEGDQRAETVAQRVAECTRRLADCTTT